jgi:ATP-dependent DNA helicase PIF1
VNGARGVVVDFEEEEGKLKGCPRVKFTNGEVQVIGPEEWNYEVGGSVMATRKQLPLNLAYALSIHKSQGMTIDKLEVHLQFAFEDGMAYVALSRATSLKTLRLVNFNPKTIRYQLLPTLISTHTLLELIRKLFSSTLL